MRTLILSVVLAGASLVARGADRSGVIVTGGTPIQPGNSNPALTNQANNTNGPIYDLSRIRPSPQTGSAPYNVSRIQPPIPGRPAYGLSTIQPFRPGTPAYGTSIFQPLLPLSSPLGPIEIQPVTPRAPAYDPSKIQPVTPGAPAYDLRKVQPK